MTSCFLFLLGGGGEELTGWFIFLGPHFVYIICIFTLVGGSHVEYITVFLFTVQLPNNCNNSSPWMNGEVGIRSLARNVVNNLPGIPLVPVQRLYRKDNSSDGDILLNFTVVEIVVEYWCVEVEGGTWSCSQGVRSCRSKPYCWLCRVGCFAGSVCGSADWPTARGSADRLTARDSAYRPTVCEKADRPTACGRTSVPTAFGSAGRPTACAGRPTACAGRPTACRSLSSGTAYGNVFWCYMTGL